jgi:hypothetical protein
MMSGPIDDSKSEDEDDEPAHIIPLAAKRKEHFYLV